MDGEQDAKGDAAGMKKYETCDDDGNADELVSYAINACNNDNATEAVNVSELANDYKERFVCCRQLVQHRVDACVTLINEAVAAPVLQGARYDPYGQQ